MKELEELLVIEPIIGYRSWSIYCEKVKGKFNFYLRGSGIGSNAGNWQKGVNIAKCLKKTTPPTTGVEIWFTKGLSGKHKVPEFNCECGFYAHKYKIDIIKELLKKQNPSNFLFTISIGSNTSDIDLYGIVELTGRVIEHSEGYRAEKVEIKKLIWADERDKISINYEDKDKKVKEKKEEKKAKNNNIQTTPLTATAASIAAANSILNPFYLFTQQRQVLAQQRAKQTKRGLPKNPPKFRVPVPSFDLPNSKPSETFAKEQIANSLQDYYQVPIIYYKDYLEKELLK